MDNYGGGYSVTSYGAQGGAGGGGFMGGSQGGSQSSPAGRGTYGKENLRPVTILQLVNAQQAHQDDTFSVDDVEISQVCSPQTLPFQHTKQNPHLTTPKTKQVTFVGQIRNVSTQTTNTTYKLDDGTATMEVKVWTDVDAATSLDDNNKPVETKPKLAEGDWARVWGRMKAFNNRRHVGAHFMRPVTDKMEIPHHLLEATYVHLYFTRGPPDQFSKSIMDGTANGAAATTQAQQQQQQPGAYQVSGPMFNGKALPNISLAARRVLQALDSSLQMNEGLHAQNIAAQTGMQLAEVMRAGEELQNHSLIYSTVDEDTWAALYE